MTAGCVASVIQRSRRGPRMFIHVTRALIGLQWLCAIIFTAFSLLSKLDRRSARIVRADCV